VPASVTATAGVAPLQWIRTHHPAVLPIRKERKRIRITDLKAGSMGSGMVSLRYGLIVFVAAQADRDYKPAEAH